MEPTAAGSISAEAVAALAAAERGDLEPARALASVLSNDRSDPARAWIAALRARRALSGGATFDGDIEALRRFAERSADARRGARHATASLARIAALRFDEVSLRNLAALHEGLSDPADERASVERELIAGWCDWLSLSESVDLEPTYRRARSAGFAAFAIEAQSLRGLCALNRGELTEATGILRRASRMSRSEGLPDAETLANIALASARRQQNRPHLALHIIAALRPLTPPAWRAWLDWEACLSGGRAGADTTGPARPLSTLIASVAAGRRDTAEHAADRLSEASWPALVRRQARLITSLLLERDAASDALRSWRSGASVDAPDGLLGLVFWSREGGPSDPVARVLVEPGRAGRRVPELAVPIVVESTGATQAPTTGSPQQRVDTGLATLAFRVEPISVADYFAEVYGHAYDGPLHAPLLSVHISRMRERLGDAADVVRDAAGLRLSCHRALILRDPTCAQGLDQRALRLLGQHRGMTARDLGRAMLVPLRTAQRLIKRLVEDGASVTRKEGRKIVYEIEDTTFSEPTTSRRFEAALLADAALLETSEEA